jgi:endo-1,3(4)-beta-glucanase
VARRLSWLGGGVGLAVLLAAVAIYYHSAPLDRPPLNSGSPLANPTALAKLTRRAASGADLSHLGKGILPPTNSWLSGLVLQATPLAVYPLPLSFLATASGFEIGLPTIRSTTTTILGPHQPGIEATIDQAASFKLSRYDKVSASLTYYDAADQPLANLTLAEGSPYVFYRAARNAQVRLSGAKSSSRLVPGQHSVRYSRGGHDYVVQVQPGATISQPGADLLVDATKGSLVSFYALPSPAARDNLQANAGNEVQSVDVVSSLTAQTATTTLRYNTVNGRPTVMATLPYQHVTSRNPVVTTFDSIYGPMSAVAGNSFAVAAPVVAPSNHLDIGQLSATQKAQLRSELTADVATTVIDKTDSYFAGKQLARAANLLDLAEQLQQTASITKLTSLLNAAFASRLGSQYFYYDSGLKGVAAKTMAFGSEDFNDHHFHYGYFLYAASIVGKYDHTFVDIYQPQLNLLAADIAAYQPSQNFPVQRTYDPYAGHSWAAGLAPFADGNNQESSSEAINAWNGVSLWGQLTHNRNLQDSGRWMLAFESASAQAAWRTLDTTAPGLAGYTSPLVDINFGGKRVYETFFSNLPSAKLGIQLIPLNPAMVNLVGDKAHIDALVQASIANDNYNVPLGDYVLMYSAISQPGRARQLASQQQAAFIDDGNSRTYLDAWIFSQ